MKQDKFVLTVPPDQLKCILTLTGDSISHADIILKVQRQQTATVRTSIANDNPWKLQQIQDAANHLQQAIYHIDDVGKNYKFKCVLAHSIKCKFKFLSFVDHRMKSCIFWEIF